MEKHARHDIFRCDRGYHVDLSRMHPLPTATQKASPRRKTSSPRILAEQRLPGRTVCDSQERLHNQATVMLDEVPSRKTLRNPTIQFLTSELGKQK